MRIDHGSISAGSSGVQVNSPSMKKKLKGGTSSSRHRHTRGSRRIARPLAEPVRVMNRIVPSTSRSNQIGTTWGLPSLRTVASLPVLGFSTRNAFHSLSLIFVIYCYPRGDPDLDNLTARPRGGGLVRIESAPMT